ncbi:hypothetical protein ACFV9E_15005 [Streptomyces sp. NPDC059835]|uniref:hypothetical protein n=1 Tax=Streptomyces sp. NPDC059835 TaxID=3346967 RepID=UPI0036602C4E
MTGKLTPRLIEEASSDGFIAAVKAHESSRAEPAIAAWGITLAGRLAVLTPAQRTALTEKVTEGGRFDSKVPWATLRSLVGLQLAAYRDEHGVAQPSDGDDGVRGPQFAAFRTHLGRQLAEYALAGSATI